MVLVYGALENVTVCPKIGRLVAKVKHLTYKKHLLSCASMQMYC